MPYEFKFYIHKNLFFHHLLETEQCVGHNKNGNRCKRKVTIGTPYCFQHLLSIKHLKIQKSKIPNAGNGLFALDKSKPDNAIIFKKGDKIIDYVGEIVTMRTLDERYGEDNTAPYAVEINKNKDKYEDSALVRGVASLSNQGNTKKQNNSKFGLNVREGKAILKAWKNIRNGEEILTDYGRDYTFDKNTSHKTEYVRP
jgi:SET domain-containing protein